MNNDTNRDTTIEELTDILIERGFERVLFEEYTREAYGKEEKSFLFVFWHKELNIMVSGTTYPIYDFDQKSFAQVGHSINSGTMYYKLKPKGDEINRTLLSSYGIKEDGTIEGNHDIRRGIIATLDSLIEEFDFLPWNNKRHLWLVHYEEEKKNSERDYYDVIIYKHMKKLPQYVKDAIQHKLYIMDDKTQIEIIGEYVKEYQDSINSAMLSYNIGDVKEMKAISDIKKAFFYKESEEEYHFLGKYKDILAILTIKEGSISIDVKEKMHPFFEDIEDLKKFLITKKEIAKTTPKTMRELANIAICIAIEDIEVGSKLKGDFAPTIKKTSENILSVDMRGMSICQIKAENNEVEIIPGSFYKMWDAPMIGWGNIILETLAKNGGFEIIKK